MRFFDLRYLAIPLFVLLAVPAYSQTIARVDVTAASTVVVVGQTMPVLAAAKDADGVVIPVSTFTWTSGTATVATVDSSGNVTALFPGSVQIRARTGNVTGNLTLTVNPAKVQVAGPQTLQLNSSVTLTATALDINGNPIPNVPFTWGSDNTGVGTVTAGVLQAVNLGEVTISATAANFIGRLTVRVVRAVDYTVETVVSSDPVLGGSTIQSILSMSNLNSAGDMAFVANLSGSTTAVVRDSRGQLFLLARTGDAAPLGGFFSGFGQPVINARGEVALIATVGGGGISPLLLLFRGSEMMPLLASGDALVTGGTIGNITLATDGLDDNGFAVVTLSVNNPTHSGVFRVSPETGVEPLIRTFDQLPIGTPTAFNGAAVSTGGRVAVIVTAGARRGIYEVTPTAIGALLTDATPVPGGGTFASFQAVRFVDLALYLLATPQGRSMSLYRATTSLEEIVRGGASTNPTRTTTLSSLLGVGGGNIVFSATLSDMGTGVYAWSNGNLRPVALTRTAMTGGETLSRLDAAAVSPDGEVAFLAVTNRHVSALYRNQGGTSALRWASWSRTSLPVNYYVASNSNLRPSPVATYFQAGSPASLLKKSGGAVTPVAMPGMTTPQGRVFTGTSVATSNANGDLVFVATSMDLNNTAAFTAAYRYFDNVLAEWFPFNQAVGSLTIGTGGLTNIALNSNRQAAFVGTVSNRQSLILAGSDIQVLLQTGATSPTGGTFSTFTNIQLTPGGSVVFTAGVTNGPTGIFMWSGGQVTRVAATDVYRNIGAPAVGGESIYFLAARDNLTGLFVYSSGTVQSAMMLGTRLPINTTLTNITTYSAQEDGTVVFQGVASFTGVFARRTDGSLATVALISENSPASGRFTSFVSLAVGESIVLTNSLVTQDRTALFTAYPAGFRAPLVSSFNFSVPDRAGLSRRTENAAPMLTTGYASIQAGAGSANPSALAIFSYRQNGVLVSEASVPSTELVQAGRIYAEVNDTTNTGVAIANPTDQPAVITFYFTDSTGQDFGQGSMALPPFGQIARFLHESPFNGVSPVSGTFTFTSSMPVSVISLRGYVNERSEFLITTLPVGPVVETSTNSFVFPHYAEGQGWTTKIVLVNSTDEAANGVAEFMGPGMQQVNYSIPPRSSRVLRATNTSPRVDKGWVRVTPQNGTRTPSGVLIFSYRPNGITVSEAGVPASPMSTAFRLFLESAGNVNAGQVGSIQTGIAVVNPSAAPVQVTFDLANLSGVSTGLVGRATIPAQAQVSLFANEISGLESTLGIQGVLRIMSPTPVSVVGLRAHYNERADFLITTVQPSDETSPPATNPLYMPHFADGGGYTTQFILFSGSSNQSSSGTLRFFSQTGQPLGLGLR
ncbi:MAG TPA: Ig-like domain-containing protein [Terriglobia bacterium]|nr:Ig-like domain-containing protein [Terriglobia bacterium]